MPSPANTVVGDLFKFTARCSANGQIGEVTCYQTVTAIGGVGLSTSALATAFANTVDGNLPTVLSAQAKVEEPLVEKVSIISGKVLESASGLSAFPFGAIAGDLTPTQVRVIVRKRTGLAGRRYNGRCYFPFVPSTWVTVNGKFDVTKVGAYEAAAVGLFSFATYVLGPDSVSLAPVLVHAVSLANPLPLSFQPILTWDCSILLGTHRSSGDYGALNRP